jgi:arginase
VKCDILTAPPVSFGSSASWSVWAPSTSETSFRPYREYVRPPDRARNEAEVAAYSVSLGKRVATAVGDGSFVVLLGGDCSIVLGALLGARQAAGGAIGLAYVDGHADFATLQESQTGSVASMCLGLAVGRGDTPLARLAGSNPLVESRDVALLGSRDAADAWYGHEALAASEILDLPTRPSAPAASPRRPQTRWRGSRPPTSRDSGSTWTSMC